MDAEEIHIGKVIRQHMKTQGRSPSWLSKKLNCHRSNIYKIFENSNMDVSLLIRICKICNYNFFDDISILIKKQIDQ